MSESSSGCYKKCEHGGYCDWWNICTGNCKDCESAPLAFQPIAEFCEGHCHNHREVMIAKRKTELRARKAGEVK